MTAPAPALAEHLHDLLADLHAHPYPTVPCPEGLQKRASVALILRVSPRYAHWPSSSEATDLVGPEPIFKSRLRSFFEQDWVRNGEPEVLFIKRTSREGDRWKGHVALPGGRRDPEDLDDFAAAVRETREEVGIDLSAAHALAVGNLPQRIITTGFGNKAIMVLCPYIFLIDKQTTPPLRLQPTEVASAHWVPIRALLAKDVRTHEYADTSARYGRFPLQKLFMKVMMGRMIFAAVRLRPSQTITSSETPEYLPPPRTGPLASLLQRGDNRRGSPPLLLWGLTLGVLIDFLDMLPPHNAVELWSCPTFTPWDIRLLIWLLSRGYVKRKQQDLHADLQVVHEAPYAPAGAPGPVDHLTEDAGSGGAAHGSHLVGNRRRPDSSILHLVLDGYFVIIKRALWTAYIGRAAAALGAGWVVYQKAPVLQAWVGRLVRR